MNKVEEIVRAVEELAPQDFARLAAWIDERRQRATKTYPEPKQSPMILRDHSAFLNSYAPEDEGLYDDAAAG